MIAAGVNASALALLSMAALAAFLTMIPVSINGYGVRELGLALLAPRLGLDAKAVVAAGLVAYTILLVGVIAAALAARMVSTGEPDDGDIRKEKREVD